MSYPQKASGAEHMNGISINIKFKNCNTVVYSDQYFNHRIRRNYVGKTTAIIFKYCIYNSVLMKNRNI